jgi:hypothetical protein
MHCSWNSGTLSVFFRMTLRDCLEIRSTGWSVGVSFPKRIVLSGRKVWWDLQEIQDWDRERKAARERSLC